MTTELALPQAHYLAAATSANTRRAYRRDVAHFMQWGGALPTTPEVVLHYLQTYAAVLNPRTLTRRLTALSHWHTYQGFADPTRYPAVRKTLLGIHNLHGQPARQAPALSLEHLSLMCAHWQQHATLAGWRNNALLQIQFFGALRVSDLLGMQVAWLAFEPEGLKLTIPRSKTDQAGTGQIVAIPANASTALLCPVKALQTWLSQAGLSTGYVFRAINKHGQLHNQRMSTAGVNYMLQQLSTTLNLPKVYTSHSLRSGFATEASRRKAPLATIMRQGRWRNVNTLMHYIEAGQRFEDNAAGLLLEQ